MKEPIQEVASANTADMERYKKIWELINRDTTHLGNVLQKDSNFSRLVERMGGDVAIIKEAYEHFKKLEDALAELQMSVGIAQEKYEDN